MLAGVAGAVCAATRPNGIVIVACCAWAAVATGRERGEWRAMVAPALAPLGTLAYFGFLWRHTGDAGIWFRAEEHSWHDRFDLFSLGDRIGYLARHPRDDLQGWLVVGLTALAVVALVLLRRHRVPATWAVWAFGSVFLAATSAQVGLRPRFALVAFPLLVPVALRARETSYALFVAASASAMAALAMVTVASAFLVP
jgi:hypothetical protein